MPSTPSILPSLSAANGDLAGWQRYLRAALEGRVDVPPLSQASAEIAAMAADGEANTAVLAQLIERDPTVAAHVIRVANSAALAPRVQRSCMRHG